jgi:hypothetical protein
MKNLKIMLIALFAIGVFSANAQPKPKPERPYNILERGQAYEPLEYNKKTLGLKRIRFRLRPLMQVGALLVSMVQTWWVQTLRISWLQLEVIIKYRKYLKPVEGIRFNSSRSSFH